MRFRILITNRINEDVKVTWVNEQADELLKAGGIEVRLKFESQIPETLKDVILHDLNLIYGHLNTHEYLDVGNMPKMMVDGELRKPDSFLKFTGKGRYFPKQLTGKIGLMFNEQLLIPNSVIQAYEEAWLRKKKNEAQYSTLLKSISRLNRVVEDPITEPEKWFFIDEEMKGFKIQLSDITSDQFTQNFGGYTYRQPSLLEVYDGSDIKAHLKERLVAKMYAFDAKGKIINSMPPLVFSDGNWKFFITRPPT